MFRTSDKLMPFHDRLFALAANTIAAGSTIPLSRNAPHFELMERPTYILQPLPAQSTCTSTFQILLFARSRQPMHFDNQLCNIQKVWIFNLQDGWCWYIAAVSAVQQLKTGFGLHLSSCMVNLPSTDTSKKMPHNVAAHMVDSDSTSMICCFKLAMSLTTDAVINSTSESSSSMLRFIFMKQICWKLPGTHILKKAATTFALRSGTAWAQFLWQVHLHAASYQGKARHQTSTALVAWFHAMDAWVALCLITSLDMTYASGMTTAQRHWV